MNQLMNIVLLGDSVFDNERYVDKSVTTWLEKRANVTLLAQDGAVVDDLPFQISRLMGAKDAHAFISVGGNDALRLERIAQSKCSTVATGLVVFGTAVRVFEQEYFEAIAPLAAWSQRTGAPVTLCTVYNGWDSDVVRREMMIAAVRMFNDAIIRTATYHGLGVLEMRDIVDAEEDFCYSVEPSDVGGQKIADAVLAYASLVEGEAGHAIA